MLLQQICHNEYKDALLNNKCIRHSMNRIQKIGTCETNRVLLFCFNDKIYVQNNGYAGVALGYQS